MCVLYVYRGGKMDKFCNCMLPVCILQSDGNVVASFDRRGQFIITGNSRGKVSKLYILCITLRGRVKGPAVD